MYATLKKLRKGTSQYEVYWGDEDEQKKVGEVLRQYRYGMGDRSWEFIAGSDRKWSWGYESRYAAVNALLIHEGLKKGFSLRRETKEE